LWWLEGLKAFHAINGGENGAMGQRVGWKLRAGEVDGGRGQLPFSGHSLSSPFSIIQENVLLKDERQRSETRE